MTEPEEEARLRAVALLNAKGIFIARQRAEEDLVRTKDALEARTDELARTLAMMRRTELENANLLAALQDSDRRKDEFLAMLAHELRNPLAPMRTAVEILRGKTSLAPDLRRITELLDRQVHQMTRLVDDLLDVSRITRGKIELRRARIDLSAVLSTAIEASRPIIERRGHELTVTLPPQPLMLDADATRLAQVFLNLLSNAAKYTDPGGRIELAAERRGDQALVHVTDNGIGIPAEMLSRIFDMFMQDNRALERAEGGLGIGLTLVERLVELHGGAVEVRSDGYGKGSAFLVRLPLAVDIHTAAVPGPVHGVSDVTAPRRILVVDDNRDAADSLVMLLRTMGHQVHAAHDGLTAVAAAAALQPDMVLLDIGLPQLNGYEAATRIRQQAGGAGIMLVALTGWGQEEHRRRSKEAGFDRHLTKPVALDALKRLFS